MRPSFCVISQKVIQGVYFGITTTELNELAAQTAALFSTQHPDYALLATRTEVSNLHKETEKQFSKGMTVFRKTGEPAQLVAEEVYNVVVTDVNVLDGAILHGGDFEFDYYFGFKTLEKSTC